jgi:hypothetical protein
LRKEAIVHRIPAILLALAGGLLAVLALVCTLAGAAPGARADVSLAPAEAPLAPAGSPTARYVALTGSDVYTCATPISACRTVQYAVDVAGAGDVIKVAQGVYTDTQGRPAPPGYAGPAVVTQVVYISKSLTVQGGYTTTNWSQSFALTRPTTLDAQGEGRVVFVGRGVTVTLEGLHVTGGDATGQVGWENDDSQLQHVGGGIYGVDATVVVSGSHVLSNTSGGSQFACGGGLFLYRGSATVSRSVIQGNSAGGQLSQGGGVCLESSDAALVENAFMSNTATWYGGGLFGLASYVTILQNDFVANSVGEMSGGGVYVKESVATIQGNGFFSNNARSGGGRTSKESPPSPETRSSATPPASSEVDFWCLGTCESSEISFAATAPRVMAAGSWQAAPPPSLRTRSSPTPPDGTAAG